MNNLIMAGVNEAVLIGLIRGNTLIFIRERNLADLYLKPLSIATRIHRVLR